MLKKVALFLPVTIFCLSSCLTNYQLADHSNTSTVNQQDAEPYSITKDSCEFFPADEEPPQSFAVKVIAQHCLSPNRCAVTLYCRNDNPIRVNCTRGDVTLTSKLGTTCQIILDNRQETTYKCSIPSSQWPRLDKGSPHKDQFTMSCKE